MISAEIALVHMNIFVAGSLAASDDRGRVICSGLTLMWFAVYFLARVTQ